MDSPRRTGRPHLAGQTLVEVLIAASILVITLMASVRTQISSLRLLKAARETERATELLNEAMAQALLATNAELVGEGGAYSPGALIDTQHALKDQELRYTLPDGGEVTAFLEIRFEISWTSNNGQRRSLSLSGGKR